MSSSPSRALAAPPAKALAPVEVLPFPYREAEMSGVRPGLSRADSAAQSKADAAPDLAALAQVRESGRQQWERESHAKFEGQLSEVRAAVATALTDFARERAAYYQKIEGEAVELALSIARKILHREAQVDPLLLLGIARVALGKIAGATEVVLAVHPERAAEWRRYLAAHLEAAKLPEIKEDAALAREQCELRTAMGTAALGVEVQLKEIEQGLADLLAARPQAKA